MTSRARIRERLWLLVYDVADRLSFERIALYAIGRAADAAYEGYVEPETDSEGEPPF